MAEEGLKYPSVFTVDSYRTVPPPLPPRPGRRPQMSPTQALLFLLVTVALCGMTVEAWLIYRLYNSASAQATVAMPSAEKMIGNAPTLGPAPTKWPRLVEAPSKPLAHLTDGQDVAHQKYIMSWSEIAHPLLYRVGYKDGGLVFHESGYYYIYSKVFFSPEHSFHHSIELKTKYYHGKKGITLLMSRYSLQSKQSYSFLAGVFHFYKGDTVFVRVSDTFHVVRQDPTENVFGAHMI